MCDGGVTGHRGYDGATGPTGPAGSPGTVASTRILTITEADWNEELTRPWLTQISPHAAYPGTPLVISGARFVAGDQLIIDGAVVAWSLRPDGAVGATLPVSSTGGAKQVYMRRGDGSESNRLSINVLPQILTGPADILAGIEVTLSGRAFLTGAHAVYNGTSYPAIVDSATSLRFTVPGSTTMSSAAQSVSYRVVNPDGSSSNAITAQLPSTLANGFEIGVHDYQFVNPDRGTPTWDTYLHTFGELEVMHELLDPVFGHPILTAAYYLFYHKFLLGTGGGGLATGFCTSMAATALDRFWTGHSDTHATITLTDDKRTELTTVHGRLLSKETLLSMHAQGRNGTASVTATFRAIEQNFRSGGTRETAPLLFFIPSGDIWDSGYFDKLSSSHCIVPIRIVYPPGSDGTDLAGVKLYCWDNNHPGNPATMATATSCRVEFRRTAGEIRFDYFPGGTTREFCSEDGITLGTMNLGDYLLSDVDLPFSGPLGLSSFIVEFLLSPATMTVTDADGKIAGQVGNQLLSQIPDSHPAYLAKSLYLLPQATAFTRSITGTATGTYEFHSLNPGGMSLSLSNVATTAGQVDGVVTSADGSRVVIAPGSAKSLDVALGRTVDAQRRGIALVGVRGDAASTIEMTVAPDLSVVRFTNAGPPVTVGLRAIGVDGGTGVSAKVSRDGITVPTGNDLVIAVSDWAQLKDATLLHSVVPPG